MNESVKLSIKITVLRAMPDPKIQMEVTLKNVSNRDLVLNQRFAVVPVYGDLRPKVLHGNEELSFKYRVRLRPVKESDFVELKSQQQVVINYELTEGFSFTSVGTYKISLMYVNKNSLLNFLGPPVFIGSVTSNSVEFKI